MYATNTPPSLTGRWRFRAPRCSRKPVLQVEEAQRCIVNLRRGPGEDNRANAYRWRDATLDDLLSEKGRVFSAATGTDMHEGTKC